jgi:hypothetical protein
MGHLGAMLGAALGAAIAQNAYGTVSESVVGAIVGAVALGAIAAVIDAKVAFSCGPWNSRLRMAHKHVRHLDPRIHRDAI